MPTTILTALSTDMTRISSTIKPNPFYARTDLGILMLWTVVMLSIGAAAHPPDFSAFELLAPF